MAVTVAPLAVTPIVTLTAAAQAQVTALLAAEEGELALRIVAQPGGCAGLRYQLYFDDECAEGDVESQVGDIRVVVDAASALRLAGATIDFSDTPGLPGFTIDNPNAAGGCACGDSCC